MPKMIKNLTIVVALAFLFVGFQNCSESHYTGSSKTSEASSSVDVDQLQSASAIIMAEKCASCHSLGPENVTPIADILDLDALLIAGYVVPGEPQNSAIYMKAIDGIMPKDEPQLTNDEIQILRDWIVALADNSTSAGVIRPPGADDPGDGTAPTFTQIYSNIISLRCVSCHRAGGVRAVTPLDTHTGVLAQVNVNNPSSSPLYGEVLSGAMPTTGAPLTAGQIAQILAWIEDGAKNN